MSPTTEPVTAPTTVNVAIVDFCGELTTVTPGTPLTIGREADLVIDDNPFLHRVFLILAERESLWVLTNAGAQLSAYLPFGVRTVLDAGMGFDRSRVSLRHAGVETFLGAAAPDDEPDARAGRYDAVYPWPPPQDLPQPDAIVCANPLQHGIQLTELLDVAAQRLGSGGEALLLLPAADADACGLGSEKSRWDAWLYGQHFHLILFHQVTDDAGAPHLVLRARRFERDLLDISTEIYERFPGGDIGPLE